MSVGTEAAAFGLKRQLSRLNILQVTINSIIGTGWLFSAMNAAAIAGPSALLAWFVAETPLPPSISGQTSRPP